ncbi:hypothetical protein L2E82_11398 [Cichorium intybus]|uniref:Uncharacterized protein n=1 Tax=Cichorium intybus TaxID=13427 RepID=A0ACB9GEB8_CICIN|nr:hypothetical protein L2E82_11398 [Cichorium intybus]
MLAPTMAICDVVLTLLFRSSGSRIISLSSKVDPFGTTGGEDVVSAAVNLGVVVEFRMNVLLSASPTRLIWGYVRTHLVNKSLLISNLNSLSRTIYLCVLMMAQPSYAPLSTPVSVIGSQFMVPYQFDIIVETNSSGNLVITDITHKIMLKVKPCDTSFHYQRVLLDAFDKPIVMIRDKLMSEHKRWNVFRGESKSKSDIIFSTKTPHMIQSKTSVHVFLANKTSSKDVCDFKIKGSWSKRNCTFYIGDTSATIAQMYKLDSVENAKFSKDKFMVTIYPNVDYAFVVTLIAIIDAMKSSKTEDEVAEEVMGNIVGTFFP